MKNVVIGIVISRIDYNRLIMGESLSIYIVLINEKEVIKK